MKLTATDVKFPAEVYNHIQAGGTVTISNRMRGSLEVVCRNKTDDDALLDTLQRQEDLLKDKRG